MAQAPPESKYPPAAHAVHASEVVEPIKLLNRPTAQLVQLTPLGSALYVPAAQAVHDEAPATRSLYEPAAHAVHTNDDGAAATLPYAPTPQAVQLRDVDAVARLL